MCRTIGTVDGRRHPDARTRGQHHTLAVPHETHDVAMGVPPPPCRCERALCCRWLYSRPRPRFALSGSSGGNWPRSAHMLRVGSVVPGACGVAILWRLYGDEDGPLRTSPNLSLRWFFSSHVWDRGHVWTHALGTVSLLLCERKHLQNARSAVLENVLHTCPVVYTRDQCLLVILIGF